MSSCDDIKAILSAELAPEDIQVVDASDGCGSKFQVHIVSAKFDGVKLLDRHRMVNEALKEIMPNIHALQMKTLTPAQWEAKRVKEAAASAAAGAEPSPAADAAPASAD